MDYKELLKVIGDNIRMKRLSQHLSLEDLAELTDGSQSHLSQIENGKRDFNFSTLVRIVTALKCGFSEIIPRVNIRLTRYILQCRLNDPHALVAQKIEFLVLAACSKANSA